MARESDACDPERGIAVNSASDPQKPGAGPVRRTPPGTDVPGTSAAETGVPTDASTATHEPGPAKGPEDRRGESGREGGVE